MSFPSKGSFASRVPRGGHRRRGVWRVGALGFPVALGAALLSPTFVALTANARPGDGAPVVAAATRAVGVPAAVAGGEAAASASIDAGCLARTICGIKDKIRWGTAAWSPSLCQTIAAAVLTASKRHDVSPSLLLAVMINESDMNEKAARVTMKNGKLYAKDSGLMGIRCVLDNRNRCLNGNVRGLAWTSLMDPTTNIEVGARELAYWRKGGAVTRTIVKIRDANGNLRPVMKSVPCRHQDHAYWAHYNHGPRYISQGYPRHYPHRVAVLDHAVAAVMNLDAPELRRPHITMLDPGKRERTADRPLEPRYKKLCSQIQSAATCAAIALNN